MRESGGGERTDEGEENQMKGEREERGRAEEEKVGEGGKKEGGREGGQK